MTFIKSSTRLGMGMVASSHGRAVGAAMAATITAATVTATAPALAIPLQLVAPETWLDASVLTCSSVSLTQTRT